MILRLLIMKKIRQVFPIYCKSWYLLTYFQCQAHFANPVYESMYAGNTNEMSSLGTENTGGVDEKKGLLQQEDANTQDLL